MLIPTFDSSGKCLSLHLKKGDGFVLIPLKRNGAKAEPDTSEPSYGYLAQEAIASPAYATLDLSDRPLTPVILPPDFPTFARIVERSSFWKSKIRKTLQDKAFTELVNMMGVIAIAGTTPERMQDLLSLWNEVVVSLSVGVAIAPADITFLNTTATDSRVPILFAANGTASVKS